MLFKDRVHNTSIQFLSTANYVVMPASAMVTPDRGSSLLTR